jgi:hypothetical protein
VRRVRFTPTAALRIDALVAGAYTAIVVLTWIKATANSTSEKFLRLGAGLYGTERKSAMNNRNNRTIILDQVEEKLLTFEIADEALEAAATTAKDKAGSLTLAFCSGLDTCPSVTA